MMPKTQHSCALQDQSAKGLLIRRSLVRAQVGEPSQAAKQIKHLGSLLGAFSFVAALRRYWKDFGRVPISSVALALCAALAACGGGSDSPAKAPTSVVTPPPPVATTPPATPPSPPAAPACSPQQVFFLLPGDSTQYGIDGSVADDSTWPRAIHNPGAELQAEMDRIFGPGAVVVRDIGVPGTVAADAARPVIPTGSNIGISPNYGLNDARYGYSVTDFMAAMMSMHPTLIETPFPRFDSDPLLPVEQAYIAAEKASGVPIADVNAYVRSLPNWQQYFPLPYSGHATDELYKMVIDNVLAPAVAKQVAPLRCVSL